MRKEKEGGDKSERRERIISPIPEVIVIASRRFASLRVASRRVASQRADHAPLEALRFG